MSDETGEPEEHCNGLDGQDGVKRCCTGEETRGEGEEGNDDEGGPNSVEDQEVYAARGAVVGGIFIQP